MYHTLFGFLNVTETGLKNEWFKKEKGVGREWDIQWNMSFWVKDQYVISNGYIFIFNNLH